MNGSVGVDKELAEHDDGDALVADDDVLRSGDGLIQQAPSTAGSQGLASEIVGGNAIVPNTRVLRNTPDRRRRRNAETADDLTQQSNAEKFATPSLGGMSVNGTCAPPRTFNDGGARQSADDTSSNDGAPAKRAHLEMSAGTDSPGLAGALHDDAGKTLITCQRPVIC